ncbi:MAG: DUF2130 domain-containing protein [Treponema sp.]|jgi:hypothetical protein|nr:DUF2130 domain-containing protein [Treponema sp.]
MVVFSMNEAMNNPDGGIRCPFCGKEFPLTKVIAGQIGAQLQEQYDRQIETLKKSQEDELVLVRKEAEKKTAERLEKERDEEYQRIRTEAQEKARRQMNEELAVKNEEIEEANKRLSGYRKKEADLLKRERDLEESRHSLEMEYQEKLTAEIKNSFSRAQAQVEEEYRLKLREKEKIIADLNDKMKEGQKKAEQGSMQLQGEVLELEMEQILGEYFPDDAVAPVETGKKGGDIIQTVKLSSGREAGRIVWELKRTKNWSSSWIPKLKEDMRNIRAEIAVIASEALPSEVSGFAFIDGVWVTDVRYAPALAVVLRENLKAVAQVKIAGEGKAGKAELVFDYLTGTQFKQRVESMLEAYIEMHGDLEAERRIQERSWAKREKQIERFMKNISGMYGDLQGLGAALPAVKHLEIGDE